MNAFLGVTKTKVRQRGAWALYPEGRAGVVNTRFDGSGPVGEDGRPATVCVAIGREAVASRFVIAAVKIAGKYSDVLQVMLL
jgi:hypothetical protein